MARTIYAFILIFSAGVVFAAENKPVPTPTWTTYSDSTYGFTLRHPAPLKGQRARTKPIPGAAGTTELPTGNARSGILLSVFTDEMIRGWNSQPGTAPFPYAPNDLRAALSSPLGTPFQEIGKAIVVPLGNAKALRFIKEGPFGVQITHFVQRGKNGWLEINLILWDDLNLSHISQNRPVPYEVQKALDAGQAVLNTIHFFNPRTAAPQRPSAH